MNFTVQTTKNRKNTAFLTIGHFWATFVLNRQVCSHITLKAEQNENLARNV